MEWNDCWSVNTVTPYFLFESTGDSEELKSDVHKKHDEAVMDESEGVSFRFEFDDLVDVKEDDDDDAQSCSYDHSSYINTRYGDHSQHDQSQRLIYDDDHEDGGDHVFDDDDDDDDDDKNQQGVINKLMDSSKQQKRSHKFCVDLLNQRETDRKFWEACLAS